MLLFLILLVLVGVAAGILLGQSPGSSHDISFPGLGTFHGTPDWVVTVIVAGAFALIALMAMAYGSTRIRNLRAVNDRLRTELDGLRGRLAPAAEAAPRRRGFLGFGRRPAVDRPVELQGGRRRGLFGRGQDDNAAIGGRMPRDEQLAADRERGMNRERGLDREPVPAGYEQVPSDRPRTPSEPPRGG